MFASAIKIKRLLSKAQKSRVAILGGLLLVGMCLEMLSIGMILPVIELISGNSSGGPHQLMLPLAGIRDHYPLELLITFGVVMMCVVYLMKACCLIGIARYKTRFIRDLMVDMSGRLYKVYLAKPYVFHLRRNVHFPVSETRLS